MNIKKTVLTSTVISLSLISEIAGFSQIARAQQAPPITFPAPPAGCTAIREISTGETVLRKRIVHGNENTDFAVPTGQAFKYYRVRMIPENNATYNVAINLKYNTGNHATVFSRSVPLNRLQLYKLRVQSPVAQQPSQINLVINGPRHNVYNINILACQ